MCNPLEPRFGYCLSELQVREVRMRLAEDRAFFRRVAVDANERSEKAEARSEGAEAARLGAVIGAIVGSASAVVLGILTGILVDRLVLTPSAAP